VEKGIILRTGIQKILRTELYRRRCHRSVEILRALYHRATSWGKQMHRKLGVVATLSMPTVHSRLTHVRQSNHIWSLWSAKFAGVAVLHPVLHLSSNLIYADVIRPNLDTWTYRHSSPFFGAPNLAIMDSGVSSTVGNG
jgi:hypothetical protein